MVGLAPAGSFFDHSLLVVLAGKAADSINTGLANETITRPDVLQPTCRQVPDDSGERAHLTHMAGVYGWVCRSSNSIDLTNSRNGFSPGNRRERS